MSQQEEDSTCYENILDCLGSCGGCLRSWLPCIFFCCPYPYVEVRQGYIGLMQRFGKFIEQKQPGFHKINPCSQTITIKDLRTIVMDLDCQSILTKDNITVRIDTCVYYRIVDPRICSYTVQNPRNIVQQITYATLRSSCGQNTLQDLLEKRQSIADQIQKYVYDKVNKWGIFVEQIFIKDMRIDSHLQRNLSMTSKTTRLSTAKIISAEADVKSAKLMHQAADILNSKAAMQIRYLDILQMISKGQGKKLMFMPLSNDEFS